MGVQSNRLDLQIGADISQFALYFIGHEDAGLDLFDLVRLQNELTDLLGVWADIAQKRNLHKRIGERILQEVISL